MHLSEDDSALLDALEAALLGAGSIPVALRARPEVPCARLAELAALLRRARARWSEGDIPRRAALAVLDLRGALSQGDRYRGDAERDALQVARAGLLREVASWLSNAPGDALSLALDDALAHLDAGTAVDAGALLDVIQASVGDDPDVAPRASVAALWDLSGRLEPYLHRDDVEDLLEAMFERAFEALSRDGA